MQSPLAHARLSRCERRRPAPGCRSGRGGRGEVSERGKGKKVDNFKYRARSSLPKKIWLPAAAPADGCEGASVL